MIGKVPSKSHLFHFHLMRTDLIDIVVSFFRDGLESNEFCICVTTDPLTAEEVRKAMEETVPDFPKYLVKGQIEMLSYTQWHLHGGCIKRLSEALAKGFDSIRAAAFIGEQAIILHIPLYRSDSSSPSTIESVTAAFWSIFSR